MKKTQFHSKRSEQSVVFDSPAQYHAVSLSGGKDSTCMLLMMIEKQMPIDVVLFADTGMEFPEMYGHLEQLEKHLQRERGLSITILRHPQGFEYLMLPTVSKWVYLCAETVGPASASDGVQDNSKLT